MLSDIILLLLIIAVFFILCGLYEYKEDETDETEQLHFIAKILGKINEAYRISRKPIMSV